MEAIKGSDYVTTDINEADIVFVDSYCYYIWWLGWVHTKGREHQDTPGDYLVAAFTGDTLQCRLLEPSLPSHTTRE